MGVFDGYAIYKYPEIEPYSDELFKRIQNLNIDEWLEQHPEFKTKNCTLLDEWYR